VVTLPFGVTVPLIHEVNPQLPVYYAKVQVKILSASLYAHKPTFMTHLLQVNMSAVCQKFVQGRSSIRQFALRSDFD
jgi:hypothetical protein